MEPPANQTITKSALTSVLAMPRVMPYSLIVNQASGEREDPGKLALELAFIAQRLEGVLLSGQRGTGKSSVVRSFSVMAYNRLPVTLPINASEDRVVGDWKIDNLLQGEFVPQLGLLEQANGGLLYVDEVNLLDDHIVNIILDVSSTGKLVAERTRRVDAEVRFTLVGTMNPSEGGLRPQLLDRFALMVDVQSSDNETTRLAILQAVLTYEHALALAKAGQDGEALQQIRDLWHKDKQLRRKLESDRKRFLHVRIDMEMASRCVKIARELKPEGNRSDYVLAFAARAHAARRGAREVGPKDLISVAPLVFQHRIAGALQSGTLWTEENDHIVASLASGM